jgi:uncharacterized protein (TIGR02246 family)
MSGSRFLPAIVVAFFVAASGPVLGRAQRSTLSAAEVKAITAVNDAFGAGVMAKDWKAVSALYVSDGVFYPPGESAVKGRSAIEACLTAFPAVTAFSMRTTKIDGRDDLAYAQGTFTMTLAPPSGATPSQESGYFLQVLRRQANGTWQIAVQMSSLH